MIWRPSLRLPAAASHTSFLFPVDSPRQYNLPSSYNVRRLQELPYLSHAVNGSIKKQYLLDLAWVYDKVCGADVFQVSPKALMRPTNNLSEPGS